MKKVIKTDKAPQAIGAYSQGIKINNLLYSSGQIPINPETKELVENDVVKQSKQVMENLKGLLSDEGLTFDNVIKTTIFIKDMNDFAKINEVYGSYFTDYFPARSCVEVSRLPKDVLIEVEVIASYE